MSRLFPRSTDGESSVGFATEWRQRQGSVQQRAGRAIFQPDELKLRISPGDPAIVARGEPETRARLLGAPLLFRAASGFKFNWRKARGRQRAPWIGAHIAMERWDGYPGAPATLARQEFEGPRENARKLRKAKGMVNVDSARARAFNAMMRGALTALKAGMFDRR